MNVKYYLADYFLVVRHAFMNPRLKYKDKTYFSLLKTMSRIYFFEIKIVAIVIDLILLFIIYTTSSTPWKNH